MSYLPYFPVGDPRFGTDYVSKVEEREIRSSLYTFRKEGSLRREGEVPQLTDPEVLF